MDHEETFRTLVDTAKPSFDPTIANNSDALYRHYGININSFPIPNFQDILRIKMLEKVLIAGKGLNGNYFRNLIKQLICQHIINGLELTPYIIVAEKIMDIIQIEAERFKNNQCLISFDHTLEWQSAII